jgi:hypothetical protein
MTLLTTKARIAIAFCCSILLVPSLAQAQAGKAGMSFLKLGVSGRGVAMGDAMSATVRGAAATYYNPAGLFRSNSASEILFMHKEWIQDSRTEFLGAAVRLDDETALGFSVNTTTVTDIEVRTRPGPAEGTFSARNLSLGVSYARAFAPGLRAAVTAKFLYEKLFVDDATGVGFDAGVQMDDVIPSLSLGASVANIGGMSALRDEASTLPALGRAGAAYSFELREVTSKVCVAADIMHVFPEANTYINAGGEISYQGFATLRTGYQFGETGRGPTLGLGIRYGIAGFDYAFSRLANELGSGHTFSLSILL